MEFFFKTSSKTKEKRFINVCLLYCAVRLNKNVKFSKRAQTWSFDLIIAVVLFIVVVALFYSFLSADTNEETTRRLEGGAEIIINQLNCDQSGSTVCVINRGTVTDDSLQTLVDMTYEAARAEFGVSGEFCIYLRDLEGNLIPLPDNYSSVGKNTTALFDTGGVIINCGEQLP